MRGHPVLSKIDINNPFFERKLVKFNDKNKEECVLKIWLPTRLDNGGWVAAVTITEMDLPPISAMPGSDPLAAIINAIYFARNVIEKSGFKIIFDGKEMGGLPVSLDRGFDANTLFNIEVKAGRIADEAAKEI